MEAFRYYGCEQIVLGEKMCENLLYVFFGFDRDQFNVVNFTIILILLIENFQFTCYLATIFQTLYPVIQNHRPKAISFRTFLHYEQVIHYKKFQKYDFGKKENLKRYYQPTPPLYDLSKVNTPLRLSFMQKMIGMLVHRSIYQFIFDSTIFYVITDQSKKSTILSLRLQDVLRTYTEIPVKLGVFRVNDTKFNHVDFLLALDAPKFVYEKVIEYLEEFV